MSPRWRDSCCCSLLWDRCSEKCCSAGSGTCARLAPDLVLAGPVPSKYCQECPADGSVTRSKSLLRFRVRERGEETIVCPNRCTRRIPKCCSLEYRLAMSSVKNPKISFPFLYFQLSKLFFFNFENLLIKQLNWKKYIEVNLCFVSK